MWRIQGTVQNYAWGKLGASSEVANLSAAGDSNFLVDEHKTYAELWMGTHPKAPSTMKHDGRTLSEWLAAHHEVIGTKLASKIVTDEGASLPFLFKVLSVNKALSIQSHPTKEQAAALHIQDPANYPDPNHKPEMAIALTPFEMLCGFQPAAAIRDNIKDTPELFELIGSQGYSALSESIDAGDDVGIKASLQECFGAVMRQPDALLQKNLSSLVDRVALSVKTHRERFENRTSEQYVLGELIIRLNYQFPGDVGCWAPFFLNHFVLQPGQAAFLGPNEPHAYLFGDCIECMACSDNTIRAGLTPKYKDIDTLIHSLTYRTSAASENQLIPRSLDSNAHLYATPVPEFDVIRVEVINDESVTLQALPTCSIVITLQGRAERVDKPAADECGELRRGYIVLLAADKSVPLKIHQRPFVAYRAFTPGDTIDKL